MSSIGGGVFPCIEENPRMELLVRRASFSSKTQMLRSLTPLALRGEHLACQVIVIASLCRRPSRRGDRNFLSYESCFIDVFGLKKAAQVLQLLIQRAHDPLGRTGRVGTPQHLVHFFRKI